MFSSKTLQLFLSITAFAAISSPTSVLAAPRLARQSKSSKSSKSKSKSAPPVPINLPPPCEGLGDPVYSPPVAPQQLPSYLVTNYTVIPPTPFSAEIMVLDTAGAVDIITQLPCSSPPNTAYPDDAVWCVEGGKNFRITAHATCLHSITDDYYFIKYVKTEYKYPAGGCQLLQVSKNAPGTWTELQTPATANFTAGAAMEWAYDVEPVGIRYKFSLCPNPEDEDNVVNLVATFD